MLPPRLFEMLVDRHVHDRRLWEIGRCQGIGKEGARLALQRAYRRIRAKLPQLAAV